MHKSFNGKSRQVKCNPTSKKSSEILPCMANSTIMYVVGLCSKRKKERVCEYLECLFVGEPWLELLADHVQLLLLRAAAPVSVKLLRGTCVLFPGKRALSTFLL